MHIARAFPALERLFVTWYEEDDVAAAGLASALAPLAQMSALRQLHLMRSGENCGALHAPCALAEAGETAHTAYETIASALPAVAVSLHDGPPLQALGTEQPLWELADTVDMLQEGALLRGLAPRYEPHNDAVRDAAN